MICVVRNVYYLVFLTPRGRKLSLYFSTVVCFGRLLKCLEASPTSNVDSDQTDPIRAAWPGSTVFVFTLTLVNNVSRYIQTELLDAVFAGGDVYTSSGTTH